MLTTTRDADEIVFVEHGVVRERGAHAALLALRGRYWSMLQEQASAPATDATLSSVADNVDQTVRAPEAHPRHSDLDQVQQQPSSAVDEVVTPLADQKGPDDVDVTEDAENLASKDDEEAGIRGISDRFAGGPSDFFFNLKQNLAATLGIGSGRGR